MIELDAKEWNHFQAGGLWHRSGYRLALKCTCVTASGGLTLSLWFICVGIAVLEGPMYAVGGHDGWSYLNTVERWDPQARQWNYVASMSTPRSTMGVTALNGK